MKIILLKILKLFLGYFNYLYIFLKRKYGLLSILTLVSFPISFLILIKLLGMEYLTFVTSFVMVMVAIAFFASNLFLLIDPDNVKCPNCKLRRVNNIILEKDNLGIARISRGKYIQHYVKTTYRCSKCNHVFKIQCIRFLEA